MVSKIGTVVLNYLNYRDTIDCVASLLKQRYSNHAIVVVENGSDNESWEVLTGKFSGNPRVTLLKNPVNLGFARGNNTGIVYAREVLGCDYVFVLNSDTLVPENLFCQVLDAAREEVGVISPTVHRVDGSYQLPAENSDDIVRRIRFVIVHIALAKLLQLPGIRRWYAKRQKAAPSASPGPLGPLEWKRFVLQGCSYFLTPSFFQYYSCLYPRTFLYWEEINLLMYLHKAGLQSVLVETDPVIHKEMGATKEAYRDEELEKKRLKLSVSSMWKSIPMFFQPYSKIKKNYSVCKGESYEQSI